MLRHIKRDLFTVEPKAILVHAVNCQGVMASGIAKTFKQKFPKAFKMYHEDCEAYQERMLGTAAIYSNRLDQDGLYMGCLFTSYDYGSGKSSPDIILRNTADALDCFFDALDEFPDMPVYSNKFNSGQFNVPWYMTEQILQHKLTKHPKVEWTVCADPTEVKP